MMASDRRSAVSLPDQPPNSCRRMVVARPTAKLLQTDEALQDEAAFGFLGRHLHEVAESHDTVILCDHDSLLFEFETVGKGIWTMIPWWD